MTPLRLVGAALLYFALIFGASYALSVVRAAAVAPELGPRNAELAEGPAMLVAILLAAGIVSRIFRRLTWKELFAAGVAAAALFLFAEVAVGLSSRGMTPPEILFRRDSLTGALYYFLIGLTAVAPALFALPRSAQPEESPVE
jgi:lysylphosphatidylglycerol synthetase-like protein (DUF2156 family)